jgi:L-2-hydroxyglutarate oxidase LhgO
MAVDYEVDCIVAGAGAIGLAIARELAQAGREVLILEAGEAYGRGVSSRSSEVIHAGMYYEPGTLRARLCVEGKWLLYDFLNKHNVTNNNCGKLIVASCEDELPTLEKIILTGGANGLDDLEVLDGKQANALEPATGSQRGHPVTVYRHDGLCRAYAGAVGRSRKCRRFTGP